EGEIISMHDIFAFKQTGLDDTGSATGYFYSTGVRPQCMDKLEAAGNRLPCEMFERRTLDFYHTGRSACYESHTRFPADVHRGGADGYQRRLAFDGCLITPPRPSQSSAAGRVPSWAQGSDPRFVSLQRPPQNGGSSARGSRRSETVVTGPH